jgi:glycerol kinase
MGKKAAPVYALEGSVAVAGAALGWLRDNINILQNVSETEPLASQVGSTGDVYFVPAFSGLYAPYWQQDARGLVKTNLKLGMKESCKIVVIMLIRKAK